MKLEPRSRTTAKLFELDKDSNFTILFKKNSRTTKAGKKKGKAASSSGGKKQAAAPRQPVTSATATKKATTAATKKTVAGEATKQQKAPKGTNNVVPATTTFTFGGGFLAANPPPPPATTFGAQFFTPASIVNPLPAPVTNGFGTKPFVGFGPKVIPKPYFLASGSTFKWPEEIQTTVLPVTAAAPARSASSGGW